MVAVLAARAARQHPVGIDVRRRLVRVVNGLERQVSVRRYLHSALGKRLEYAGRRVSQIVFLPEVRREDASGLAARRRVVSLDLRSGCDAIRSRDAAFRGVLHPGPRLREDLVPPLELRYALGLGAHRALELRNALRKGRDVRRRILHRRLKLGQALGKRGQINPAGRVRPRGRGRSLCKTHRHSGGTHRRH